MTFTASQIARQRERVLEAALQRVRCTKLGIIIDAEGMLVRLPHQAAERRAVTLLEDLDEESELLLTMLSASGPVEPRPPPDPREHEVP